VDEENDNVANIAAKKASKRGAEVDWNDTADVRAFERVGTIVKYLPPGSPRGFKPYLMDTDLSAVSSEDIENWERAGSDARLRSNRINFLKKKLAEVDDIGDLDDLDNNPGSQEAQDIRDQIAEWEAKPDAMSININYIVLPAGLRWNLGDDQGPIPIEDPVAIRKRAPLMIVQGLATNVVKAINGDTSVIAGKSDLKAMRRT